MRRLLLPCLLSLLWSPALFAAPAVYLNPKRDQETIAGAQARPAP